ncbi:GTP cyclohydrolase II [Halovulum sp. GXIMD14793]
MQKTSDTTCLTPTPAEHIARAQSDLRMGLPSLFVLGDARAIVVSPETIGQARFESLQTRFGAPELVMTLRRALAVLKPAAASNLTGRVVRINPPENAGFEWFQTLVDTKFDRPNTLIGPLHILRNGETELHGLAVDVVKNAELLPAVALFTAGPEDTLSDLSLMPVDVAQAVDVILAQPSPMPVSAAGLPIEAHETSRLHVFRDPTRQTEHYALEVGTPDRSKPVLSRLHSACFTGDVLGSLKCDCGPQLRAALARMGEESAGVLLYLNQEGRGIGLANKMRVYDLQSQGFDTVEANHRLGFEDDERDFRVAAKMLRALGFEEIRLLTNNLAKIRTFKENGVNIVEQLPLRIETNPHNEHYLSVKAMKSGHLL